jgi:hypothetical protein
LSALQVQAAWIEVAPVHGEQYGSFAAFVSGHAAELAEIIRVAKSSYPNLLVAYLSSRIYAGYAAFSASPEPFAYQSAFAVRRVILEQAEGARSLNADPLRGPVAAPVLLWGPYLWSNGARPRRDGFAWQRGDFERDGVHPNARGSSKAGRYLLSFMLNDPTSRDWVRRGFEARP